MIRRRKEKVEERLALSRHKPVLGISPHFLYLEPTLQENDLIFDLSTIFGSRGLTYHYDNSKKLRKRFKNISMVHVPEKFPSNEVEVVNIHRAEGHAGVFTTTLGECSCLAFVQVDYSNQPERISAFHFSGGLEVLSLTQVPNLLVKLLSGFDPLRPLSVIITDGLSHGRQGKTNMRLERSGNRSEFIKNILKTHGFKEVWIQRTYSRGVLITFDDVRDLKKKPNTFRKR